MPLRPGVEVVVRTFGSKRGVVVAASRDGRYRVQVESATMWCREEDLEVPAAGGKKRAADPTRSEDPGGPSGDVPPPGRMDLHGLTVEEAVSRVVDEIDRALRRGADRVEVVHGKGSGRVRTALHRQLEALPVVRAFRLDPRNPGVTWVYL